MRRRRLGSFLALAYAVFFVAILCLTTVGTLIDTIINDRELWGGVVVLGLVSLAGVAILWRCAYAATDGQRLFLTTVRGTDDVPLEAIAKVVAHSKGWRYIEVHLDTPARLGRTFWIFGPQDFSGAALWDAYEFLAGFAKEASHDRPGSVPPRTATRRQNYLILSVWVAMIVVIWLLSLLAGS